MSRQKTHPKILNSKSETLNNIQNSKQETKILNVLQNESLNIDEIAAVTGESIVEIGKTVSLMAIKGLIIESGGKYYAK